MNNHSRLCKDCGTENPDSFYFCDQCGASFDALENCAECGTQQRPGARFCGNCGSALSSTQAEPPEFASNSEEFGDGSPSPSTREFHRDALKHYVQLWFDPEHANACEVHANDAAFHILQYTGLLLRQTGNSQVIEGLLRWDVTELEALLSAVCGYLEGQSLSQRTELLLRDDALEPEELEQLDDLLIARDGIETALGVARRIYRKLPAGSQDALCSPLASVIASVAEFDDLIRARPDVLSVLGSPLSAMREEFVESRQEAWWFNQPDEMAQALYALTLEDLLPKPSSFERVGELAVIASAESGLTASRTPVLLPLTPSGNASKFSVTPGHDAPAYSLEAAASSPLASSIFLRCDLRPEFGGRLDSFREGLFMFRALDEAYEASPILNGLTLVAKAEDIIASAIIKDALAELTASGVRQWFLLTPDGQMWPLVKSM